MLLKFVIKKVGVDESLWQLFVAGDQLHRIKTKAGEFIKKGGLAAVKS